MEIRRLDDVLARSDTGELFRIERFRVGRRTQEGVVPDYVFRLTSGERLTRESDRIYRRAGGERLVELERRQVPG
ncbi:hypothetical protein AD428_16355 [Achromobacter sp. DMS1]|nr:hypothetical protein AD428_16355 [Achromobacter sp. DMS1]